MGNTIKKSRTVQQSEIVPGTFVTIRGNIEYSHLVTPIDGEELERDKDRRIMAGVQPISRPYTAVQITNARVLPRNPGGLMTKEEMYVDQRMYQLLGDGPNGAWHYTCINRDTSQPNRFFLSWPSDPTGADQIFPEHELDNGLDVILVLRIFLSGVVESESQSFQKKGIELYAIILQEPVRYLQR